MKRFFQTQIVEDAAIAAKEIIDGSIVGLPTETVYGLGANAIDENAVLKIFEIKDRPKFNPVIVHVEDVSDFEKYAVNIQENVYKLAERFSPGPLTFVLKKKSVIPDIVTAGNDSVAMRIPSHRIFREVLKLTKLPIAAPSANRFGKISPTTAGDVLEELNGKIRYILDGGRCEIGIESTVVSFLEETPVILRHGYVTKEQIEDLTGNVLQGDSRKILSPGMIPVHYAPDTPMYDIEDFNGTGKDKNRKVGMFDPGKYGDLRKAALNLYSDLRKLDKENYDVILYKKVNEEGIGAAINDRLARAACK